MLIRRLLPLLALPYGFILILILLKQPSFVGMGHDDGVYLCMAQSMRRGDGPVPSYLPEGLRSNRYPILFPLMLAAAGEIIPGTAEFGMKGSDRLLALNGLWLMTALYLFLRLFLIHRNASLTIVLAAGSAAFTSPYLLMYSRYLFSESFFIALLMTALVLAQRYEHRPSHARLFLFGAISGCLPAVRMAGFPPALGFAVYLLIRRNRRQALQFAAYSLLAFLPFFLWGKLTVRRSEEFQDILLTGLPYFRLMSGNIPHIFTIMKINIVQSASAFLRIIIPGLPLPSTIYGFILQSSLIIFTALCFFLGIFRRNMKKLKPEHPAILFYLMLIAVWPFPNARFLLPVLPLIFIIMLDGLRNLLEKVPVKSKFNRYVLSAVAILMIIGSGLNVSGSGQIFGAHDENTIQFMGRPIEIDPFYEAADWLKKHTEEKDVFACTQEVVFYLLSGRHGVWAWVTDRILEENYIKQNDSWMRFYSDPPPPHAMRRIASASDLVLEQYRRVRVKHIILTGPAGNPVYESVLNYTVNRNPETSQYFELKWRSKNNLIRIYRFSAVLTGPGD